MAKNVETPRWFGVKISAEDDTAIAEGPFISSDIAINHIKQKFLDDEYSNEQWYITRAIMKVSIIKSVAVDIENIE